MTLISTILVTLVAIEFFYIMYLETIVPTSESTNRVSKMDKQELRRESVTTLSKNQGIYNGLIGTGPIYSVYFMQATMEMTKFLLTYIILVAAHGSLTSSKKITLTQSGLAIVVLLSLLAQSSESIERDSQIDRKNTVDSTISYGIERDETWYTLFTG